MPPTYLSGWFDPDVLSAVDNDAPVITLVSPADFDDDYTIAAVTPIIIDITDTTPGVGSVLITISGAGFTNTVVVYNNAYLAPFSSSTTASITDGTRFTFIPTGGWVPGEIEVFVLAIDVAGNIAADTFTWTIDAPEAGDDLTGNAPFRDSVWRWRRRLNRQKCSVISVAIDDAYTPGPGFTLTALAVEVARKPGLDRVVWRNGTGTNPTGSGSRSDGT